MADTVEGPLGDRDALTSTIDLLARVREGDSLAVDALFERTVPPLRRWARGRLPQWARDLAETLDLVQEVVISSLRHLSRFEAQDEGAFLGYLRTAIDNRIRDEIRRVGRRPEPAVLDDVHADRAPSPLEHAIGRESLERYESALADLKPADREAVIARMELQLSYEEVALALGRPNANAARMAVKRAIERLIEAMDHGR